jgi:hypothetical protein
MKFMPILAIAAFGLLTACDDKPTCTQEVATQKMNDLTAKMTEMATADPTKMAALAPKMQEIAAAAQAAGAAEDAEGVCKAIDDLMAEISK